MKLLITGAGGQLGRSVQGALAGHELTPLSHAELEITSLGACIDVLEARRPDAVIHCAAMTDTNRCEKEPAHARDVNGIGTENMAKACSRVGSRFVAMSTNEVFDGAAAAPYNEDAHPHPVNAYGHSKFDGEALAIARCPNTLVVRASWLYGDGYVNFNEKVLTAAHEGRPLSFVTDEVATPTATDELAGAIGLLLKRGAEPGIYQLSSAGEASRYDWAREILRLAGMGDVPVSAVTTAELRANGYAGPVKPPYSVLANNCAAALGIRMRDWREALADYFARRAATADA
jgi:dTDP-4-dehydrorhamnose reductase